MIAQRLTRAANPSRTGVMAAFALAHLSDPHLPPLPAPRLRELMGKRALGYLNWTRNRHKYQRRDVLDALVSDMHGQGPDHVAVTGDFVNLALNAEFEPARAWLEARRPARSHQHRTRQSRRLCSRDPASFCEDVRALFQRRRCRSATAAFPFLRRRGPLALIGVSSAVPTAPLMATGWLGRGQLEALDRLLVRLSGEPLFPRAVDPSSAALGCARQAADRFERIVRASETAWRGSGPARARPHAFDDVDRWSRPRHPRDRRAIGVRAGAWPLPGRGL